MDAHAGVLPIKEEAFWASIIAKWSDACNNIVLLKAELEKAQSEFEKYRKLTAVQLKAKEDACHSQIQCVTAQSMSSQAHDEIMRTKLREAEEGLARAKSEYLHMKDQSDSHLQRKDEELQRKNTEIAALALLKDKLEEANSTLMNEKQSLEDEFKSNKTIWQKQLAELESLHDKHQEGKSVPLAQNPELDADRDLRRRNSTDLELQEKLAALSQEACLAAADNQEKDALREELSSTHEKLRKANETNQLLLDKNRTLSQNLTKFKKGLKSRPLRDTPSTATSQHNVTSTSTPAKQKPTSAESNKQESGCTIIKEKGSRKFLCPPPPHTNGTSTKSKAVLSQPVMQSVSACYSSTPIPEARRRTLAQLTDYIPDVDCTDVTFRRALLASSIGGSIQSLIVRVTQSQTALAKTHDISMYLCPALELNPWCPTTPGKHGYMFVGLGQEEKTFMEPHVGLNVFLGKTRSHGKPKEYCYLGVYTAFKIIYSNTTKEKNKDPRTVEVIRAAYDAGGLSVPCVRLQCTGFNEGLYNVLLAARSAPSPPRPDRTAEKRRRDDEDDYPAQSRRSAPHETNVAVGPNDKF
ncbi:hypothetical protein C0989_007522 [Termitomyces sp. Mn162]|nr:hypothetical protein C0989_007522 [Termitomyces sp. Mn162]